MNVSVVGGAGYVGLITGLGLAEIGHQVTNVDVDEERIRLLEDGESVIYEVGIEAVLKNNLDAGRLRFTMDMKSAVSGSEIVFIAVGTPSHGDGQADLSQVIEVAETLERYLNEYKIIVLKSTVPIDTAELVRSVLSRERQEGVDFDIVANPEFLREGQGLSDFFFPNRIVIGASSERARDAMRSLYQPIIMGQVTWSEEDATRGQAGPIPVVETDLNSAQMIKYASNAFLATRVSFINEIAGVCENVGADMSEVARGMGYDPRIGHDYLKPGLGFGGPCLEKDLLALIKIADGNGYEPQMLKAVLERNEKQVAAVVTKIKGVLGHPLYRRTIAIFGLAFKAGTSDVRNSLALRVIDQLQREGATIKAHDPVAISAARAVRPDILCCEDPHEAVRNAEALLILTEWPNFRELDYAAIKSSMALPCIIDAWNLLDMKALETLGFTYLGVGRP